jgi:hypothetical protein
MRKTSFLLILLGVLMLAVAPVMAQTNTVYTQSDADGPEQSYFNASAFHSGMSGVPYTAWGFTSGTDPMGMYSIVGDIVTGLGGGIGAASKAPAYTSPCPTFLDTNGATVNGGCMANNYAFDWGNGNAFGAGNVGNNSHTIVDDMLAKMFQDADTFQSDNANYLLQQVEVLFMRDYITNVDKQNAPNNVNQFPHTLSSDMFSLFVDQTIDQDLAWSSGDSSSYMLSPNPNTPDLKAGTAIRGILSQRFQLGSTSGYTILGFKTFAAWSPTLATVVRRSCGGDGPCSDANVTTAANGTQAYGGGNGNDHAVSQWVVGYVKDFNGVEGIVSSYSGWFMRENNFKECPTPFPGVALETQQSGPNSITPLSIAQTSVEGDAGEGGPCSWTYAAPGPFTHNIPEIDQHPAGGFIPDP